MKHISFFISACLIVVFLASITGCRPRMPWSTRSMDDRIEKITKMLSKKLDLTDEQKKHLNVIKDEIKEKLLDRKIHATKMLSAIQEEIRKDTLDRQRLEKLYEDRKQSGEDMYKFMLDKFAEFHATLTKEQRIKLNELIDKMRSHFADN